MEVYAFSYHTWLNRVTCVCYCKSKVLLTLAYLYLYCFRAVRQYRLSLCPRPTLQPCTLVGQRCRGTVEMFHTRSSVPGDIHGYCHLWLPTETLSGMVDIPNHGSKCHSTNLESLAANVNLFHPFPQRRILLSQPNKRTKYKLKNT